MHDHPSTPKPVTHTHVIGPGAALAEVAETIHTPGECAACSTPVIRDDGSVLLGGNLIGHVHNRELIAGKRVWKAVGLDGEERPRWGNRAHHSEERAALVLVKAVRRRG